MKHLLFIVIFAPALFAVDLSGIWVSSSKQPDGHTDREVLVLKQTGNQLAGRVERAWGNLDIQQGTVDGNHFTITAKTTDGYSITCEGVLEESKLHVKVHEPHGTPFEMIAVHSDTDPFMLTSVIPPPALRDLPPNGLAKTPPMGWNSWNLFAGRIDDKTVRQMADAIVSSGMRDAGYIYLNIDDTWEGDRDANGVIHSNNKFPDMKALADYVHSKGLKFGIYSSPGPYTCAGYEGSYGHETQDARTYAEWGIDYLKYDWCSAARLYPNSAMRGVYQKMADELRATNRPIVYSLCQYGREDVWKWGPDVGGNLWRTTGDISDRWESMSKIGFSQHELAPWARPGHWNDPDMLEIGNGGMTDTEYKTHMSLWSILAAPLIAGNDLRSMTPVIRDMLTNREVIAIDQDKDGKQGRRRWKSGEQEIWVRPLAGGAQAVGLFNRAAEEAKITASWADLEIGRPPSQIRDVWAHTNLKADGAQLSASVPGHGVILLRVSQ